MPGLLGLSVADLISRALILIVAFTIHELSHAVTADQLGDPTARRAGRITLNPLAHLDPIGSLMLLVAGFGWAKPVPFAPFNLRWGPQIGAAVVAAAGPFSNLVLALLAVIPFRLGLLSPFDRGGSELLPSFSGFMLQFIIINIYLMLFNLIPVAPLDGSKILRGFAPRSMDGLFVALEQWGPFLLMALVFLGGGILGTLIGVPANALIRTLLGV